MSEQVIDQSEQVETSAVESTPERSEPSLAEQLMAGQDTESGEAESPPESAEPPAPTVVDRLRELGFEDVDESNAQDRLLTGYQQTQQQLLEMRQRQEELAQLAQYGRQYLQQQQQQYEQPQHEQQQSSWWSPPQVDTDLLNKYRSGDGWKEGTPVEIRQSGDAYDAYVEKWIQDLARKPDEVLPRIIQSELDRLLDDRLGQFEQIRRHEAVLQNIVETNSNWLYERDARTNQPAVDFDGTRKLTPAGRMAMQHIQTAVNMGIVDPEHQWNYAMTALAAQRAQAAAQQQRPQRDPRLDHLQRAAQSSPQRSGSMETPEQPLTASQNPGQSAGHKLLEQLRLDGQPVG